MIAIAAFVPLTHPERVKVIDVEALLTTPGMPAIEQPDPVTVKSSALISLVVSARLIMKDSVVALFGLEGDVIVTAAKERSTTVLPV